ASGFHGRSSRPTGRMPWRRGVEARSPNRVVYWQLEGTDDSVPGNARLVRCGGHSMKTLVLFGTLSLSLLAAALVPTPPGISLTYSGCHLTPHGLLVLGVCLSNDTSHAVEYQAWGGGKPVMLRLRRTSTDDVLADCVPIDGIQRWIELPRGRNVTFDVLVNHLIDVDELYADVSVKVDGVMVSVRSTSVPVGDVRGIVDRAGMRGRSQQFMKAAMGDWDSSSRRRLGQVLDS